MRAPPILAVGATGCLVALVIYILRQKKIEMKRISLEKTISHSEIEKEICEDISFTTVEPDRPRKLTRDYSSNLIVVGVCGGTGSGKTTLSQAIIKRFGKDKVTYLSHDYYYKDLSGLTIEQRSQHNFDHPSSLDTALMVEHLTHLKQGEAVQIPMYDFATHTRCKTTKFVEPSRVILVEGILIFADQALADLMDIKIFVETAADIRFIRRLKRDMMERERSAESVMTQYMKSVRPMHITFVEPSKRVADIIIPQGVNEVALDMIISRLRSFTANETFENIAS